MMTRKEIQAEGYIPLCRSSDLHCVGYSVLHWFRPRDGAMLLEYVPRNPVGHHYGRERRVACTHAEQVAIHRELGLGIVGPGEQWDRRDGGQPGLFDSPRDAGDQRP